MSTQRNPNNNPNKSGWEKIGTLVAIAGLVVAIISIFSEVINEQLHAGLDLNNAR